MVSMLRPEPKNKRKKRLVVGRGKGGFEDCIYYNVKHVSHFDVLVSMRIGNKQIQRKKKNLKFITEAKSYRDKFIDELESIKAEHVRGDMYWSQALEMYVKHLNKKVDRNEMGKSTYETRVSTLNSHTKIWSPMKLSDFCQDFIRTFIYEKSDSLTKATQKNVLKFVRQVFQYQISMGNKILRFNPAGGISITETRKIPNAITKNDMSRIIEHAEKSKLEWAFVYYLAYTLGCRSGELYALKWDDINWSEKNVKISKSYCWKAKIEKAPKNNEPRTVPFSHDTYLKLENLYKASNGSIYILPRISGWKSGYAAKVLRKIQSELGINETNFHSIRATFITQLLLANIPPIKVMLLAGHAQFSTTQIYVRAVAKELKGATDVLDFTENLNNLTEINLPDKKTA